MTTLAQFPIGYHSLHRDVSLNFQMNRFYNWVGDPQMLDEMRAVAPRIRDYADYTREFRILAEQSFGPGAESQRRFLSAGGRILFVP